MRSRFLAAFILGVLFGCLEAKAQDRGLAAFKARIVKVEETTIELLPVDQFGPIPGRKTIVMDLAEGVRFDEVDLKIVDGKRKAVRKSIAQNDLVPTQSIEIVAIMVGNRPAVVAGVVLGESLSGARGLKLVSKLGGKARDRGRINDEKKYDVDLSNCDITDDALLAIATIEDLVVLDLSNTKITDEGIAHLANHPELSAIVLSGTKVTNKALAHLATLPKVSSIEADRTSVTQEAMIKFAKSKSLSTYCLVSAGPKGEYKVVEELTSDKYNDGPYTYLMKRSVYYGRYYPDSPRNRKPTTYFHRDGPVGAVLSRYDWFARRSTEEDPSEARLPASTIAFTSVPSVGLPMDTLGCLWSEPAIAVVELNAGTIAAYGRPYQRIDFYDNTPELVPFNFTTQGKKPPFGFVEDAIARGCDVRIIDGPFKESVRKNAPRGFYGAIFIDTVVEQRADPKALKKADVHFDLMTEEAIRELMDKTVPNGVLCFHTSHRTHEFYKPLAAAASSLGYACKRATDSFYAYRMEADAKADTSHFGSEWVIIARRPEFVEKLRSEMSRTRNLTWMVPETENEKAWHDGKEPEMPIRPLK